MSPPRSGDQLDYDVVVVGGGPAGTTAAIYATRLGHRTAVFEREGGRHAAVDSVHNVYGVSETVSGDELSAHAADQLREYGGDYHVDPVTSVERTDRGEPNSADRDPVGASSDADGEDGDPRFRVESAHATVGADRIVFATGFRDVEPPVDGLLRFTGRGLHYCIHCDAYTLGDSPVFVLGHDEAAAHVAMVLLNVTDDVDLLLDGRDPQWSDETERQLAVHPVDRVDRSVEGAFTREEASAEPWLGGLEFADGTQRSYRGGFAMYGREYRTELATDLGCECTEDGAIAVDERQATSVPGVYAVGDVTHGQNQTAIAMGDGARAGIALHKDLRRFPHEVHDLERDAADRGAGVETTAGSDLGEERGAAGRLEAIGDDAAPAAPADLRARMRALQTRPPRAGLRAPEPWEWS